MQLKEYLKYVFPPVHPTGWPFIAIAFFGAVMLALVMDSLGYLGLLIAAYVVYFFRDPPRVTPLRKGLIISPGDGVVCDITSITPPVEMGLGAEERTRISIFLSIFDVHVNRAPVAGAVKKLVYQEGAFLNASLNKASEDNERQFVTLQTDDGVLIGVVQIAGLIARRIVCNLKEDQAVQAGERFGIIRFGSRVDIYLPPGVQALILKGQRCVGGETILADLACPTDAREAITH